MVKICAVQAAIFGTAIPTEQPIQHSLRTASSSDSDERPQIVELEQQPAQLPAMTNVDVRSTPSANSGIVCCLECSHWLRICTCSCGNALMHASLCLLMLPCSTTLHKSVVHLCMQAGDPYATWYKQHANNWARHCDFLNATRLLCDGLAKYFVCAMQAGRTAQLDDPALGTANASKLSWRERALLKKQQQMNT